MGRITLKREDEKCLLLVEFIRDLGPQYTDMTLREEVERLDLAFQVTPDARRGERKYVGTTSCSGLREDAEQHFECLVEPSSANVAALRATGFEWDPEADELARRQPVQPEFIATIRENMNAAHVEMVKRTMEMLARPAPARRRPWWQFWRR
jgi:hypothetical protein